MQHKLLGALALMLSLVLFVGGCSRAGKEEPAEPQPAPNATTTRSDSDTGTAAKKDEPARTALSDDDKIVLKNLEVFGVKHEVDDKFQVVRLVLEGKKVTDDTLDEVAKLPNLKRLSLARSSVTDAGLLKLKDLAWLTSLGLTDTAITNQGLKHLEKMPSLRYIWVCENDKLTKEGVAALRQALLGVTVYVMNDPTKKAKLSKKTAGK